MNVATKNGAAPPRFLKATYGDTYLGKYRRTPGKLQTPHPYTWEPVDV